MRGRYITVPASFWAVPERKKVQIHLDDILKWGAGESQSVWCQNDFMHAWGGEHTSTSSYTSAQHGFEQFQSVHRYKYTWHGFEMNSWWITISLVSKLDHARMCGEDTSSSSFTCAEHGVEQYQSVKTYKHILTRYWNEQLVNHNLTDVKIRPCMHVRGRYFNLELRICRAWFWTASRRE